MPPMTPSTPFAVVGLAKNPLAGECLRTTSIRPTATAAASTSNSARSHKLIGHKYHTDLNGMQQALRLVVAPRNSSTAYAA